MALSSTKTPRRRRSTPRSPPSRQRRRAKAICSTNPRSNYPARLVALAKLWGEDRVRPGDDTLDALEPARIGIAPDGVLAVLGPGLVGPLIAIAGAHPGKIECFEWRDETFEALKYGVRKAKLEARVAVARIDLEAHVWTPNSFDGLLSIDDFAYVRLSSAPRAAGDEAA